MTRLTAADLLFINRVAARRFAGSELGPVDTAVLDSVLASAHDDTLAVHAARLIKGLLERAAFSTVPMQTSVLVLHCTLALNGRQLLAPQGVLVGMLRAVADAGDVEQFRRWLDDRTVPSASYE